MKGEAPALLQTEQCIGSPYKQRENAGLMTMQMPAAAAERRTAAAATMSEAAATANQAVLDAAAAVEAATEAVAAATEAVVTAAEATTGSCAAAAAASATRRPSRQQGARGHEDAPADGDGKKCGGPRKNLRKLLLPQRARLARAAGSWPLLGLGIALVIAAASLPGSGLPEAAAEDEAWPLAAGVMADPAAPPAHWEPQPGEADPCGAAYRAIAGDVPFGLGPKLDAEMDARIDRLLEEHDAVLAEYGFVYEEPELTYEQDSQLLAELDAVIARHAELLDELDDLLGGPGAAARAGFFEYSAAEAAVHMMIQDEQDEVLRGYGFVIEEPQLSASDEQRFSERLDVVWNKIDAVYEEYRLLAERQARDAGCPPPPASATLFAPYDGIDNATAAEIDAEIGALAAEYEAILAEYGMADDFVLQSLYVDSRRLAGLTDEQLDEVDAALGEISDRHMRAFDDLAARLASMLANGSITLAEAFEQGEALRAQMDADYDAALAELGLGTGSAPALSAEEEAALAERLADVLERIEAVYGKYLAPPGAAADAAAPPG